MIRRLINAITPRVKRAGWRFIKVVGGQVLAVAIVATINFLPTATPDIPALVVMPLGAALTALDKYLRDREVY